MSQNREQVIAAAEAYIFKGIMEQKPDEVPFADDCIRIELGMNTGRDGQHLRDLFKTDAYDPVEECFDLNWTVEGDQACVFYKQKWSFSEVPARVATRFKVIDGKIKEIEILFFNFGIMDATAEAVKAMSET